MKSFVFIFVLVIASVKAQDVEIPDDLLDRTPNVTDRNSTEDRAPPPDRLIDARVPIINVPIFPGPRPCDIVPPFFQSFIPCQTPNGGFVPPLTVQPVPDPPIFNLRPIIPLPPVEVPPNIDEKVYAPESEVHRQCPIGSFLNGTVCVDLNSYDCPHSYVWRDDRCVLSRTVCPLNFEWDGRSCHQHRMCPSSHIWRDGRCVLPTPECPLGWRWNGNICEVDQIQCQPGTVQNGSTCVYERFTCPPGFREFNNECTKPEPICPPGYKYTSGFCSATRQRCPSGSSMVNEQCRTIIKTCPEGTTQIGEQCFRDQQPEDTTTQRNDPPWSITTWRPPTTYVCPEGFTRHNNLCYKCPDDHHLCNWQCIHKNTTCTFQPPTNPTYPCNPANPTAPCNPTYPCNPANPAAPCNPTIPCNPANPTAPCNPSYPCNPANPAAPCNPTYPCNPANPTAPCNPTIPCIPSAPWSPTNPCYHQPGNPSQPSININLNTKNHGSSRPSSDMGYNIVNHIEPVINKIVNFNNITHPVTLNNMNTNNIYVYSNTQCPDGSIGTVVVKNNETVSGCIEANPANPDRPTVPESPVDEKCCEVWTPRQCKKRDDGRWACTHKRFKYCGHFCVAERVYLRPRVTTYINFVLTIAPQQPSVPVNPCFGRRCPPIDCDGCTDGSSNCSPECFTYPCNHDECTYLDHEDFCGAVGGQICE